jgi:hypothetical protein
MISPVLPTLLLAAAAAIRCNLNALNPEERALHGKDTKRLVQLVQKREELADGYRLQFRPSETSASFLLEWISHERRCCPFLRFQLEWEPESGPVWLTLRGPEGTKELLTDALRSPASR